MTEFHFKHLILACNKMLEVYEHLNVAQLPALEERARRFRIVLMKEWERECKRIKRAARK